MPRVLIIGFGNCLRGDDGAGCRIARKLDNYFHQDPDVRVIGAHQLTPEMSEDIAGSEFVLFLDAAVGEHPGKSTTPRSCHARTPEFHPFAGSCLALCCGTVVRECSPG